jgi:lantibiotic transport system permease protein
MEMAYIQAENLKHKRTFTKTLIVLAPFVTALMNFFAPLWFQLNSYNWWYNLLYPGFLTLTCALIEQRDNGKLKYRAVASLPVSQNKVWKAKIGVAGIYSCVGNFIFLALNL